MKLLRTIAVTFAQYSRIPVPHFGWKDEDMRYSMSVFPWVGAVIGALYWCVYWLSMLLRIPETAAALLMTAVPVLVTGGFHIDGFMDVSDAVSSYRSREEKLRILKDPHIGAFAVIRLVLLGLIYVASVVIVISRSSQEYVIVLAAGFFLARALSALSVLTFRSAKEEGMLYYEATAAAGGHKVNLTLTIIWCILGAFVTGYFGYPGGALALAGAALSFTWYKYLSYKEFGGITGDTAGWFVTVCETMIAAGTAAAALIS